MKTESLDALVAQIADRPAALAQLADAFAARGDFLRARELCMRALSLAPDDPEVYALTNQVFAQGVRDWYAAMVSDHARNLKYERALARAIHPGDIVLDIGCATGLFSMMAARVGAAEVFACEKNPSVAAATAAVVAQNGYADRIHVIPRLSTELQIGVDLPRKADVLIWDNLANNMIGAGGLDSLEHAYRWLLAPDARIIPAQGTIQVALAEDPRLLRRHVGTVEGFDLTPFNRSVPAYNTKGDRATLRSESRELFAFDFASGGPFPGGRASVTICATGGLATGVLQWLTFEVDEHERYDNRPPGDPDSTFAPVFYPIMRPIQTTAGQTLTVHAMHNRSSIRIWIDK